MPRPDRRARTPSASGGATTNAAAGPSATALCDYLRTELPKLKSVGSKVGAEAQLAVGLAGFFETAGKPTDGSQLDELTTKDCPRRT